MGELLKVVLKNKPIWFNDDVEGLIVVYFSMSPTGSDSDVDSGIGRVSRPSSRTPLCWDERQ